MAAGRMDVFLVPIGRQRHELYCEVPDRADSAAPLPAEGWVARFEDKFRAVMQTIDRRSRETSHTRWARLRNRALGWLAERVAEQRLLWQLRLHRDAVLHFPHDLGPEAAISLMRQSLSGDVRRHGVWLAVNLVLLALAGLLTVIPGPNVVAFYFAFRVVGHYMSIRGAKHGLAGLSWTPVASEPLTQLRRAVALDPSSRAREVSMVAERLELEKLASFVERMALRGA